jgi:predicted RND superfamily exporter protein
MPDSYVLINCEAGYEKPVFEELKQFENITDVTGTFGPYDIIVKVKEKPKTLSEIVEQIRQIQHITSTLTLPSLDEDIQPEKNGDDLIPDVIPEEKKPLEPPDEIDDENDEEV